MEGGRTREAGCPDMCVGIGADCGGYEADSEMDTGMDGAEDEEAPSPHKCARKQKTRV